MKRILFTFTITLISFFILAQNTGHVGKHLSIKTDLVNGKRLGFTNADIGVTVSRNFTLTLSGRYFNYETADQTDVVSELIDYDLQELKNVKPGKTEGVLGTIGGKYFLSKITPAPLGYFVGMEIGGGYIKSDYRYKTNYKLLCEICEKDVPPPNPRFGYNTGTMSAPIIYGNFYAGYQTVFFKFLTLEAKIGLESYYTLVSSSFEEKVPYNYVEPNTVPLRVNPKQQRIGDGPTRREYRISVGPAVYVKVGFLLF